MEKKEKSYWPEGITAIVLVVVGLIIWTVDIAISNPVSNEKKFGMKYQDVDENYNEIQKMQKDFLSAYKVETLNSKLAIGSNKIEMRLVNIDKKPVQDAEVDIVLSRPHTDADNKPLGTPTYKDGIYESKSFEVKKEGRYRLVYNIKVGGKKVYLEHDINASL